MCNIDRETESQDDDHPTHRRRRISAMEGEGLKIDFSLSLLNFEKKWTPLDDSI